MMGSLEKQLRAEIDQLKEQVAWYKSTLGLSMESAKRWHLAHELRLTMQEARVLLFLYESSRPQGKWALHHAMYDDGRTETAVKIVDVYICKLRRKLRNVQVHDAITTIYAEGYKLTDAGRKLVAEKLAQLPAKAVRDAA